MGLFSKKKSKKEIKSARINDAFNRVYSQIDKMDSWEDPKKLEHYILDSCEQIIASTKEMERQKQEYRIVTAYLNDVKTIEELHDPIASELRGAAGRIKELEASIEQAKTVKRNISEEQFEVISSDEDDMPAIINRLTDDEMYQDKLKRSLNAMEGEKSRWEIEREHIAEETKILRTIATVVLASFLALVMFVFTLIQATGADLTIGLLVIFVVCSASGFAIFLKQSRLKKDNHVAYVRLNQAIRMLNVERIKYVNVTNGIEFQHDKYHVSSASELQYVWQQYMDKIRDQQHYIKSNEDLEFYIAKLDRILGKLELHDANIWSNQTNALINHDDMTEVRHRLVQRRQKIRARIEENKEMIQNERDEIDRLMIEHEHYLPEIQEIIKSVDKLCGTSASGAALKNRKRVV